LVGRNAFGCVKSVHDLVAYIVSVKTDLKAFFQKLMVSFFRLLGRDTGGAAKIDNFSPNAASFRRYREMRGLV